MIALRLSLVLFVVIFIVSGCQTSQTKTQLEPELAHWANQHMDYMPMSLHNVHVINLSNSDVNDQDLKIIPRFYELNSLDLSNTNVTDVGLNHIKKAKRLWSLNLAHTQVTDAGIAALACLSTLDYLDVTDTVVSEKIITNLQNQNKDLYVNRTD